MIDYSGNGQIVEAIEEGRIVRVAEDYARREGLLILRKPNAAIQQNLTPKEKKDEEGRRNKGFIGMDDLRKPLKSQQSELMKEMVENFHWVLVQKRKAKGLMRKKLGELIGESETNIKMIENGVLPMNNFVLVNKLESFYGISLRKNKVAENKEPLRQVIDFAKKTTPGKSEEKKDEKAEEISSDEIIDLSKV